MQSDYRAFPERTCGFKQRSRKKRVSSVCSKLQNGCNATWDFHSS